MLSERGFRGCVIGDDNLDNARRARASLNFLLLQFSDAGHLEEAAGGTDKLNLLSLLHSNESLTTARMMHYGASSRGRGRPKCRASERAFPAPRSSYRAQATELPGVRQCRFMIAVNHKSAL